MKALRFFSPALAGATALLVAACSGDDTAGTGGTSASSGGTGGGASSSSSTMASSSSSGPGGSGSSASTGTGGAGGSGGMASAGGAGGSGGGSGGSGGAGGSSANCTNLPPGPFTATLVIDVLMNSEDFAFDGKGRIAAKQNTKLVLVDAGGQTTDLVANFPPAYGMRYKPDGNLVAALNTNGKVVEITPNGVVTDYVTGLSTPNGLYPDFDGNVWMTESGAGRVSRINPDKTIDILVMGTAANNANGIVLDPPRSLLFYTNYGAGRIRSLNISQAGATPVDVVTIPNTALDGLVMDACGNLYAVDNGMGRLYRIWLDSAGAAMGPPEFLADLSSSVANAQFGSGTGFDPLTLYVGGGSGDIYAVPVGVAGAPVPTPP